MNKDQSNHYSMFKSVNSLLTQESELISSIPALVRVAAQLDENVKQIEAVDSGKIGMTEGKADAKGNIKRSLARKIGIVADALYNYAVEKDLHDLEKTVNISEYRLFRLAENNLLSESKALVALTTGKETDLADQGLTAEEIADANSEIASYEDAINAKNTGTESSIASNKNLDSLISETSALLETRVDRFMKKFRNGNPDFYNRYNAARRIIDLAATHNTSPETVTGDQTNPQ